MRLRFEQAQLKMNMRMPSAIFFFASKPANDFACADVFALRASCDAFCVQMPVQCPHASTAHHMLRHNHLRTRMQVQQCVRKSAIGSQERNKALYVGAHTYP